jgi:hypothetical protein
VWLFVRMMRTSRLAYQAGKAEKTQEQISKRFHNEGAKVDNFCFNAKPI